jgi:hypothetical protein
VFRTIRFDEPKASSHSRLDDDRSVGESEDDPLSSALDCPDDRAGRNFLEPLPSDPVEHS